MDDDDCGCPFCDGRDVPPEIVEKIEAAATQPGVSMTPDEFLQWLKAFGR